MLYWNDSNFEGLEALAERLSRHSHLSDLADYCRLRANGLRGKAFGALDRFLNQAEEFPAEVRNDTIDLIYGLAVRAPSVHQFISNPLTTRFLRPGLDNWLAEQPSALSPLRWDGIFHHNNASLEQVLEHAPADALVRRLLIWREYLNPVDFAFHHIAEGTLLSEIREVEAWIAKADALLEGAPDRSPLTDAEQELSEQKRLLFDWKEFCDSGATSFPEWCAMHGRQHNWTAAVYYSR